MSHNHQATPSQLMSVIQTQTAIAKLGLDLNAVMTLVAEQAQQITNAKGAVVELDEDGDMVYRAVSGGAAHLLGLRLYTSIYGTTFISLFSGFLMRSKRPER